MLKKKPAGKSKKLRAAKKLEERKPLSKAPTESVSFSFGTTQIKY